MYMNEETRDKYFIEVREGEWVHSTQVMSPKDFRGDIAPFGYAYPWSDKELSGDQIALIKYCRAHKKEELQGNPAFKVSVEMPWDCAGPHFLDRSLKVVEGRPHPTVGFCKPLTKTNYPNYHMVGVIIPEDERKSVLAQGYSLLESYHKRPFAS